MKGLSSDQTMWSEIASWFRRYALVTNFGILAVVAVVGAGYSLLDDHKFKEVSSVLAIVGGLYSLVTSYFLKIESK